MTEQQYPASNHEVLKKFNRRTVAFILLLSGLAIVAGYLLSKINLIGRTGIALFYKEYRFFKSWWKGTLAVLAIWLFLLWLQGYLQRKLPRRYAGLLHVAAITIAGIGLYFTYNNFREDVSHRIIGERFHLGFYLFWIGWMLISLFYLFEKKQEPILP